MSCVVANQLKSRGSNSRLEALSDGGTSFLFGLAPCGVCHARAITGTAVRSYRTFSPLPRRRCPNFVILKSEGSGHAARIIRVLANEPIARWARFPTKPLQRRRGGMFSVALSVHQA